ncbi:MAG: PAS domain-containing protein [Candidatus Delongbacteria bacterium]|nr:PAS domain-containing protein [Candidatus Delongbacteria bacterium]MBN2834626.1 PAS domain-containing protein [Candidatus Delongbacteria bacterium]
MKYLQAENLFEDYIDTDKNIYVHIDKTYRVIDCNLSFCGFLNSSRSELVNSTVLEIVDADDKAKFIALVDSAFKEKPLKDKAIIFLRDANGVKAPYKFEFNMVKENSGKISGMFIKLDKFVEKKSQSTFSTTWKAIYKSLSESYAIITSTMKNVILTSNPGATAILGFPKEIIQGKDVSAFVQSTPENLEKFKKLKKDMEQFGKASIEIEIMDSKNEMVPMHFSISNIISNNLPIGRLAVGRDLREEKALEKANKAYEIKLQNQSKLAEFGMMIQGVAHNLNTPLTGMKSSAQLMQKKIERLISALENDEADKDDVLKTLESIQKSNEMIVASTIKQEKIINNMMSKARQEQSSDMEELDISAIVEQELEFMLANQFFKNEVEKFFELKKGISKIYGIYSDFSQVFTNLIKNALDAMYDTKEKQLFVKVYEENDKIIFRIKDTGTGIPDDIKDKIFNPFFTTKPKYGSKTKGPTGTGIGLDNVVSILKAYNGNVQYKTMVDIGSEFLIIIPISQNQKNKIAGLK